MNVLKSACVVASIIVGMGNAIPVLAKSTGRQLLGESATALDIWSVRCPIGTISAAAQVLDLTAVNNPAWLKLVLVKRGTDSQEGASVASTQDLTEGGRASPKVVLFGSRNYWMQFYKIRPKTLPRGADAYQGRVICNTRGGPVEPSLTRTQNQ